MNRKRNFIAAMLALFMVFSLVVSVAPVQAEAVTQSEIDALKKERDNIRAQKKEKQAIVDELEAQHANAMERKLAMDERNAYTLEQMDLNEQEISLYDQMIEEKAEEVKAAKKLEEEQLERYRVRVRAMEENGKYGFLALVLNASNLGELLTTMDDIGEIMESDRKLEDEYIAARENTEKVKAEYEEYKAELEEKQETLRAEQIELQKDIDEATAFIASILEDINGESAALKELNDAEAATQDEINKMIAELEEQRRKEEEANRPAGGGGGGGSSGGGGASGTGSFSWPIPSCSYITSRFGERIHPVTGVKKTHYGLDVGASSGATITAADGGTVTVAGNKGNGYGIYVMINHGNGYYTLYGHMSSVAVSEGQSVSKGDTIGYVGSTGLSTGPHCHFEIRINGSCIDPAPFFSGLSYSPSA